MIEDQREIKLLFFSSETDQHTEILKYIPAFFTRHKILHYNEMEEFTAALRDTLLGLGIVLIVIRDEAELDAMIGLGPQLYDHTNILILKNFTEKLLQKALKLYPRYTTCLKEDYSDIHLVLKKMIAKIEETQKRRSHGN